MGNEGDLGKRLVGLRVPLEICRAVEKEFSRPGDKHKSDAFLRALEEATRNVPITLEDFELIRAEYLKNEQNRMEKRKK